MQFSLQGCELLKVIGVLVFDLTNTFLVCVQCLKHAEFLGIAVSPMYGSLKGFQYVL